jgi:hypothetical protein
LNDRGQAGGKSLNHARTFSVQPLVAAGKPQLDVKLSQAAKQQEKIRSLQHKDATDAKKYSFFQLLPGALRVFAFERIFP